jgi:hypothetical protein
MALTQAVWLLAYPSLMLGIYIVAGMALIGAVFLVAFYHQKRLKMTSQTVGQIIRSEQREIRDERERRDETVVVCAYAVNGKQFTIEQILRGRQASRYPVGKGLTVYYNPGIPEMSRIELPH